MRNSLASLFSKYWWIIIIRGLYTVSFGAGAIVLWPFIELGLVLLVFGYFILIESIISILAMVMIKHEKHPSWALGLDGVVGLIIGALAIFWPDMPEAALIFFIALWSLVTGVVSMFLAVGLRREIQGEWVFGLGGIVSFLFGLILILRPDEGGLSVAWMISFFLLVFGILLILLGARFRKIRKNL
jgi:uncharacterized membrane protein HdeD (DUF308 family)